MCSSGEDLGKLDVGQLIALRQLRHAYIIGVNDTNDIAETEETLWVTQVAVTLLAIAGGGPTENASEAGHDGLQPPRL